MARRVIILARHFLLKIYLRSHNLPYLIMAFNHTHSINISPINKRGTLVPKQLTTIKPILVIKKLNLRYLANTFNLHNVVISENIQDWLGFSCQISTI